MKIYVIVATNKFGVDESPIVVKTEEAAVDAMKELFVWGLFERSEIMEEYANKVGNFDFEDYDDLKEADMVDNLFNWLKDREDVTINNDQLKFLISDDDEDCDAFEVSIWEKEI